MESLKLGALLLAAAATGSAATLLVDSRLRGPSNAEPNANPSMSGEQLTRLETLLNDEIKARAALEDYVYQRDSADASQRPAELAAAEDRATATVEDDPDNMRPFFNERMQQMMRRRQRSNIKQRLIDSGFGEDEAERVLQRQAEIDLNRLYEDYDQRRARALESPSRPNSAQQLRAELGDEAYQRYLEALAVLFGSVDVKGDLAVMQFLVD